MSTKIICDNCRKEVWPGIGIINITDSTFFSVWADHTPQTYDICSIDCMIEFGKKLKENREHANESPPG